MHGGRVRDEGGKLLKIREVLGGLAGTKPQAVSLAGARGYDPKFPLGLRAEQKFFLPLQADFDGFSGHVVLGVIAPGEPAENVGVNKDGHGLRCASLVYGFAARINRWSGSGGHSADPGAKAAKPFFWKTRQRGQVCFGGLVEDAGGDRCLVRTGRVGLPFEPGIGSWRHINCKRHGKMLQNSVLNCCGQINTERAWGSSGGHKPHKHVV